MPPSILLSARPAESGRPRVLVVEDESLIAHLLVEMLDDLGCEVVGPAASVSEAIELIEDTSRIDAALVDVKLGEEQCDPITSLLLLRHVPTVLSTGYPESAIQDRFPGIPIILKPYAIERLEVALGAFV